MKITLGDLFDYLVSKLFMFVYNYNKINTSTRTKIRKLNNDNISDMKSILLTMLIGIANSLFIVI